MDHTIQLAIERFVARAKVATKGVDFKRSYPVNSNGTDDTKCKAFLAEHSAGLVVTYSRAGNTLTLTATP